MNTKDCSRITKSECTALGCNFYFMYYLLSNVTHPTTIILFVIHMSRHVQYSNVTSYDFTVVLKLFSLVH